MKKHENNSQFTLSIKCTKFGLKFGKDSALLENNSIDALSANRNIISVYYEEYHSFFLEASMNEYNEKELQKEENTLFSNLYIKNYSDDFSIESFKCCKCKRIIEISERIIAGCEN